MLSPSFSATSVYPYSLSWSRDGFLAATSGGKVKVLLPSLNSDVISTSHSSFTLREAVIVKSIVKKYDASGKNGPARPTMLTKAHNLLNTDPSADSILSWLDSSIAVQLPLEYRLPISFRRSVFGPPGGVTTPGHNTGALHESFVPKSAFACCNRIILLSDTHLDRLRHSDPPSGTLLSSAASPPPSQKLTTRCGLLAVLCSEGSLLLFQPIPDIVTGIEPLRGEFSLRLTGLQSLAYVSDDHHRLCCHMAGGSAKGREDLVWPEYKVASMAWFDERFLFLQKSAVSGDERWCVSASVLVTTSRYRVCVWGVDFSDTIHKPKSFIKLLGTINLKPDSPSQSESSTASSSRVTEIMERGSSITSVGCVSGSSAGPGWQGPFDCVGVVVVGTSAGRVFQIALTLSDVSLDDDAAAASTGGEQKMPPAAAVTVFQCTLMRSRRLCRGSIEHIQAQATVLSLAEPLPEASCDNVVIIATTADRHVFVLNPFSLSTLLPGGADQSLSFSRDVSGVATIPAVSTSTVTNANRRLQQDEEYLERKFFQVICSTLSGTIYDVKCSVLQSSASNCVSVSGEFEKTVMYQAPIRLTGLSADPLGILLGTLELVLPSEEQMSLKSSNFQKLRFQFIFDDCNLEEYEYLSDKKIKYLLMKTLNRIIEVNTGGFRSLSSWMLFLTKIAENYKGSGHDVASKRQRISATGATDHLRGDIDNDDEREREREEKDNAGNYDDSTDEVSSEDEDDDDGGEEEEEEEEKEGKEKDEGFGGAPTLRRGRTCSLQQILGDQPRRLREERAGTLIKSLATLASAIFVTGVLRVCHITSDGSARNSSEDLLSFRACCSLPPPLSGHFQRVLRLQCGLLQILHSAAWTLASKKCDNGSRRKGNLQSRLKFESVSSDPFALIEQTHLLLDAAWASQVISRSYIAFSLSKLAAQIESMGGISALRVMLCAWDESSGDEGLAAKRKEFIAFCKGEGCRIPTFSELKSLQQSIRFGMTVAHGENCLIVKNDSVSWGHLYMDLSERTSFLSTLDSPMTALILIECISIIMYHDASELANITRCVSTNEEVSALLRIQKFLSTYRCAMCETLVSLSVVLSSDYGDTSGDEALNDCIEKNFNDGKTFFCTNCGFKTQLCMYTRLPLFEAQSTPFTATDDYICEEKSHFRRCDLCRSASFCGSPLGSRRLNNGYDFLSEFDWLPFSAFHAAPHTCMYCSILLMENI